jgi:hypothetical protein
VGPSSRGDQAAAGDSDRSSARDPNGDAIGSAGRTAC